MVCNIKIQVHSDFIMNTVASFYSMLFALMGIPTMVSGYFFSMSPEPTHLQKYM